ncbi:OLC1v1038786C1 [Oldenlandia corymbosa var. corymbosa]|uniref:OLC1v1038786C1 n=1 Tax=Oldenlandia corymbosa var. corymbosa TaxID=529605 RepID=A0AAV1D0K2_OLDCO|nr:OLC1v1038786C1 [Oldenlandia corymbosa var. corymbosa]
MGSADDEYGVSSIRKSSQPSQTKFKLKILILVILTNLVTIYIFTGPNVPIPQNLNLPLYWDNSKLLRELNATKRELANSRTQISDLQEHLKATNILSKSLQEQLTEFKEAIDEHPLSGVSFTQINPSYNELLNGLSPEAKRAMGPHKLPLGYYSRVGSDELYPSVGGACLKYKDELEEFMKYEVGGECPVDDVFAQKLMMKGCEPMPRRRCHPKSPRNYADPTPLPESLWSTPSDTSIIWDPYSCKNYSCLNNRRNMPGYFDCNDCFDLKGREKTRWLVDNGGIDFGIDKVLKVKPPGTIRIGLDIGGGSGTFAARMKERNVTIVTTSMNLDGPFNSFIASRGLISMHVTVSQRLPFFENTLDIVHSMHVLSNWIPDEMLELTFYDIYRVLRPGGIFWLDHFFCFGSQLNTTYVPMIDRVGFKKLRWSTGMKVDRGIDKNEWYFSALLEKPKL